jgi:hypothetical protein
MTSISKSGKVPDDISYQYVPVCTRYMHGTYLRGKVCTRYILGIKSMYQLHTGSCRVIAVPYYSMVHTGSYSVHTGMNSAHTIGHDSRCNNDVGVTVISATEISDTTSCDIRTPDITSIWILADVRCRTSDVRHRIIPMLHTMSYVWHVRHRTRTTSYVMHVRHRISMLYVWHIRHRNT